MAAAADQLIEPASPPVAKHSLLKALILCLSYATLCFVNVWTNLTKHQAVFFRSYTLTWEQLTAVTLDILLLAVVLWIPVALVVRSDNRIAIRILKWCALLGFLVALNILRWTDEVNAFVSNPALQGQTSRIIIASLSVSIGLLLLWKWERVSIPVTTTVLTILAPILPLVIATGVWDILTGPPSGHPTDRPLLAALSQPAGAPHLLWMIFDEWDESMTFRNRPANLPLPELDRFRDQSFHAERAYPPSRETVMSVPSLLTGKTYVGYKPTGFNELMMTYDRSQPPEPLSVQSSVFSEARRAGFNSGIVGFFLPYCRIFDVTACDWHTAIGFVPEEWGLRVPVGRFMWLAVKRQIPTLPFARRLGIVDLVGEDENPNPVLDVTTFHRTHDSALRSMVDPRLNLVFMHWNIPHPPGITDGNRDGASKSTYVDNLRLLNQTVGEIRLTLEKAGLWDSSTILMSSDHPLRFKTWSGEKIAPPSLGSMTQASEVPFLLKMAGQKEGFAYTKPMQTVVSKDLLMAIMKGEIHQPRQVAEWLDSHPPRQ